MNRKLSRSAPFLPLLAFGIASSVAPAAHAWNPFRAVADIVTTPARAVVAVVPAVVRVVPQIVTAPVRLAPPILAAPVRIVTAPVQAVVQVARGENVVESVAGAVVAPLRENAAAAAAVAHETNAVEGAAAQASSAVVGAVLGPDTQRVHDALTAPERLAIETAPAVADGVNAVAQGENIANLAAAPLTAALREAYGVHEPRATALPVDVRNALAAVVSAEVLGRVRVTMGALPDITVASLTNEVQTRIGGAGTHAVTIDNVIIFDSEVDLHDRRNWLWLLHEIRHVEQYAERGGIAGFAAEYLTHSGRLESDAQASAEARMGTLLISAARSNGATPAP